jgi:RNA polymerase sigma-70 factor (ECF subfamily)
MSSKENDRPDDSSVPETRELAERFRTGDTARFRELYERIAPSLCAWARLRSSAGLTLDPDDFLQEVWLRAYEGREGFDPARGSFRAWIFGIAKHVALEAWRRGSAQPPFVPPASPSGSGALEAWPEVATSIRSRLARDESTRLLLEHVERFEPVDRTILLHCGMEGVPCTVVATRIGLSADATTKRWQRLRARLAEQSFADLLEI